MSNFIYDVLKYIVVIIFTLLIAQFIPPRTSFGSIINRQISLTLLNAALIIIFAIAGTLFLTLFYSRKKYKLLQQDNYTDELTGILNYKALKDLLPKIIETCRKQNMKLSMILIDIDDFKEFNRRYSYQTADQVMAKAGALLKSDSRATDTTFRQYLKGDEFLVVARETELPNALIAANRKRNLFKTGLEVESQTYRLTVSCGVTEFNFANDTQDTVLARLNNALQAAKSRPDKNAVESII